MCLSARLGHGAVAASSRAARPPAAAHPCPQRRRAIAGPRPHPPPQPPPALGRRRRRHSRIPCAAPPPAAPGQRRKSRRAPAKSPRRETAPYADGAASALWLGRGSRGYFALGLAPARSLVRHGVDVLAEPRDPARRCGSRVVVSKSLLYLHGSESSLVTSFRHPSTRAIEHLVSAIPAGASMQLAADGSGPARMGAEKS